jgi:hypothetical protein
MFVALFGIWGVAMTHDTGSSKKVAVLTGLTMLVGGAEISTADAATTGPQTLVVGGMPEPGGNQTLNFNLFNPSLGDLQSVTFGLQSGIFVNEGATNISATATVNGSQIFSQNFGGTFNAGPTSIAANPFFVGVGTFSAFLQFSDTCITCGGEGWSSNSPQGLSVTYTFNPVPLPAALPLFASGVAGLGLMGWLKRRKQKAKKQA